MATAALQSTYANNATAATTPVLMAAYANSATTSTNTISGTNWTVVSGSSNTLSSLASIIPSTSRVVSPAEEFWRLSGALDVLARDRLRFNAGWPFAMELPDGSTLHIDAAGNYRIEDEDALVTYAANRQREFNRYVNASDLLEEFIEFVHGVGGIDKQAFLRLPIELFIRWLVIRAAEADGEAPPVEEHAALIRQLALPAPPTRRLHHCRACGRFVSPARASRGLTFCSPEHYARLSTRIARHPTPTGDTPHASA